jgi:uncharacterized protein YkwD
MMMTSSVRNSLFILAGILTTTLSITANAESMTPDDLSHILGVSSKGNSTKGGNSSTSTSSGSSSIKQIEKDLENSCGLRVPKDDLADLVSALHGKKRNPDDFQGPVTPQEEESGASSEVLNLVKQLNEYRAEKGAPPLTLDMDLTDVATQQQRYLAHKDPITDEVIDKNPLGNQHERAAKASFNDSSETVLKKGPDGQEWTADTMLEDFKQLPTTKPPVSDLVDDDYDSVGIALAPPGTGQPVVIIFGKKNSISPSQPENP